MCPEVLANGDRSREDVTSHVRVSQFQDAGVALRVKLSRGDDRRRKNPCCPCALESSRRTARDPPGATGIKGRFAGKHRSRYYRQYVHSTARVESERNRGVNEREEWRSSIREETQGRGTGTSEFFRARATYTYLYTHDTHARPHIHTHMCDSFIYALVVTHTHTAASP